MKVSKLGKNGVRLLREAVRNRAGLVVTSLGGGRGAMGGRVRFGGRDSDAAIKLRDAGLLVFKKHEESAVANSGFTVRITDAYWEVTDAGRAAVAALPPA